MTHSPPIQILSSEKKIRFRILFSQLSSSGWIIFLQSNCPHRFGTRLKCLLYNPECGTQVSHTLSHTQQHLTYLSEKSCVSLNIVVRMGLENLWIKSADHIIKHLYSNFISVNTGAFTSSIFIRRLKNFKWSKSI